MFSLVAGAALPFRAAPALFRVCLVAWLLAAACLATGAKKRKAAPPALPEIPEKLTPEQADALLAKLTDAQARALLAQQLHANAKRKASPPEDEERGLGPWLMGLVGTLESTQLDGGDRKAVAAQGFAQLPAALSAAAPRLLDAEALAVLTLVLLAGAGASHAVRRTLRSHRFEPAIG